MPRVGLHHLDELSRVSLSAIADRVWEESDAVTAGKILRQRNRFYLHIYAGCSWSVEHKVHPALIVLQGVSGFRFLGSRLKGKDIS